MKMRDELYTLINDLPEFYISKDIKLCDLERLEEGIYKINECLPVSIFEELPYFNNATGEIGIILADSNWLLIISHNAGLSLPYKFIKYLKEGAVQFCTHSHPFDGRFYNTDTPSVSDLNSKDIQGLSYIISKDGFTEINTSQLTIDKIKYIYEAENMYDGDKHSNDYLLFLNVLYDKMDLHRRRISYDDKKQIMDIISNKCNLKTSFWEKDVSENRASFPGFHR